MRPMNFFVEILAVLFFLLVHNEIVDQSQQSYILSFYQMLINLNSSVYTGNCITVHEVKCFSE